MPVVHGYHSYWLQNKFSNLDESLLSTQQCYATLNDQKIHFEENSCFYKNCRYTQNVEIDSYFISINIVRIY